jgi:hypothetical protein
MLNKGFGALVGLGLGHNYFLKVRGIARHIESIRSRGPAGFMGTGFLVAPRERTPWVRNAEAVGQIALKRGVQRRRFQIRIVSDDEKSEILKEYLDRFNLTVQRYF